MAGTGLNVSFIWSDDQIEDLRVWAASAKRIALDTETTGLDPWAPGFAVRQVCFGAADGSAFVLDGRNADLCRRALRAVRETPCRLWAHNASFDALALAHAYGVKVTGIRCSLVASRYRWPDAATRVGGHGYSLKDLRPATEAARDRLAARWALAGGSTDGDWLAAAVRNLPPDDPTLMEYVATDVVETARLVAHIAEVSLPGDIAAIKAECDLDDHWRWTTARGYLVDEALLERALVDFKTRQAESARRWGTDLTSNSTATRNWVQERGIECLDLSGTPTLSHKHFHRAFVPDENRIDWQHFVELREAGRNASKLRELASNLRNGRLHPQVSVNGAVTGRMSISRPALQNIPPALRPMFLPDPGTVLIGCDLDSVEPMVAAAMSGDRALRQAVTNDVYVELAVAVWGEQARSDPSRRKTAKTAFLAQLYGQGTNNLAARLDVPTDEASHVVDGLRTSFPDLFKWISRLRTTAREGRDLTTNAGRPLPGVADAPYKAVNYTVQGTAADVFKACNRAAVEALDAKALWLPIHDELIIQVEDDPAVIAESIELLREAMTSTMDGVIISGRPEVIGHHWQKAP